MFLSESIDIASTLINGGIVVVTSAVASILTYNLTKRKYNADVHKSEAETTIMVGDKLVDLLNKLEAAHIKSLEDKTTIADLRHQLKKCLNSHQNCFDMKQNVKDFLTKAEGLTKDESLLSDIKILKRAL